MSTEHRLTGDVIREEQIIQRPQHPRRNITQHEFWSTQRMPQIRMLRQPQVFLTRPERYGFKPDICNDIFKIRIRDDLYPMPARCKRSPQPDHRMDVAIAAERS